MPLLRKVSEKNKPFARSRHMVKSRILGHNLLSGTSRTKAGQGGLVRVALF